MKKENSIYEDNKMKRVENVEINIIEEDFFDTIGGKVYDLLKESHENGTRIDADVFHQALKDDRSPDVEKAVRQELADGRSALERAELMNYRGLVLDSYKQLVTEHPARTYSFKIR